MDLTSLAGSFAHLSTDWIILFVVALLLTLDAVRTGASRAIALSLALPITYLLSIFLAKTIFLGPLVKPFSSGVPGAVVVLTLLGLTTACTYRISRDYNPASVIQAIMAGLATTAIFAVFWMQMPALSALWQFSAQTVGIFGSVYALLWTAAAYGVLASVRS